MKVLLVTLLLVLLCSTQVLSLRCYTCDNSGDDICKTVVECAPEALFCKAVSTGDGIVRTCEELCAEDNFTNCCEEDECQV